jgi:hypothetical protein
MNWVLISIDPGSGRRVVVIGDDMSADGLIDPGAGHELSQVRQVGSDGRTALGSEELNGHDGSPGGT